MLKKTLLCILIHGQENEFCGKTLGNKNTSYALMLYKKNLEFVKWYMLKKYSRVDVERHHECYELVGESWDEHGS
jgi:hypothetical protein